MKYKTIFGDICKNPVAYCKLHKASISKKQMDIKGCLKRGCYHLSKYNHPFWEQRSRKK